MTTHTVSLPVVSAVTQDAKEVQEERQLVSFRGIGMMPGKLPQSDDTGPSY